MFKKEKVASNWIRTDRDTIECANALIDISTLDCYTLFFKKEKFGPFATLEEAVVLGNAFLKLEDSKWKRIDSQLARLGVLDETHKVGFPYV